MQTDSPIISDFVKLLNSAAGTLAGVGREGRDDKVETLRGKYATKLTALHERIRRAEQSVAREQSQASQAKVDALHQQRLDIDATIDELISFIALVKAQTDQEG